MAIAVNFYTFSKKKNSTKRPTGSGTTFNCVLKEGSGVLDPVIVLSTGNPSGYNYAYISSFGRYYFINEWYSDHDMWIAHLSVDVLASWKSQITGSSQYVVRSGSAVNPYLQDSVYPMSARREFDSSTINAPFTFANSRYVVAVSNADATANSKINGLQYMIMSKAQIVEFMRVLLTDDYFGAGATEAAFGLTFPILKSIVNPVQYIGEAYILPFTPHQDDTVSLSNVFTGWWNLTGFTGSKPAAISNDRQQVLYSITRDITINKHPQIGLTSKLYLNFAPYVERVLYAGPFGSIVLNDTIIGQLLGNNTSITIKAKIDVDFKGHAILYVYNESPYIVIERREADLAIPIPLTQSKQDIAPVGDAILTGSVGLATGEIPGGIFSGIKDAVSSIVPTMQTIGRQGSMLGIYEDWHFQIEYRYISEGSSAANLEGSPLCEVKQLSSLTGFCMVDKPYLDIAAYDPEYDQISAFMSGGFFLE